MDHDATDREMVNHPHLPKDPDDPVSQGAGRAIAHLNADHADALLDASDFKLIDDLVDVRSP